MSDTEELFRLAEEQKGRLHATTDTPHEFEAVDSWAMTVVLARSQALFCEYCVHRAGGDIDCKQRWCDTLDRVRNRLWKVDG